MKHFTGIQFWVSDSSSIKIHLYLLNRIVFCLFMDHHGQYRQLMESIGMILLVCMGILKNVYVQYKVNTRQLSVHIPLCSRG